MWIEWRWPMHWKFLFAFHIILISLELSRKENWLLLALVFFWLLKYVHWRLEKTNPLKCEENSSFGILWHKDLVQSTAEDQDLLNVFLVKSVLNIFLFCFILILCSVKKGLACAFIYIQCVFIFNWCMIHSLAHSFTLTNMETRVHAYQDTTCWYVPVFIWTKRISLVPLL